MKYGALLKTILEAHSKSRNGAAGAVNRALLLRNWIIGAHLIEFDQQGEDRASYGDRLLSRIADDLHKRRIAGLGVSILERCRRFYLVVPQLGTETPKIPSSDFPRLPARRSSISYTLSTEYSSVSGRSLPPPLPVEKILRLSWSHWQELIRLEDPWKRAFYENECLNGNWSIRQLQRQIETLLYERTGLSKDKKAVIARARKQATGSHASVEELIRDPYMLEFVGLAEKSRFHESDLEGALLDHLQAFLLELGTGFCFEARQKRITVGNEHDYIDLIFYHRRLRFHLLIDLKIRSFRHADAGQMNYYLNYWKEKEMEAGDQAPVGLVLCSDREQAKVEYATAGISQRLFVSRYLVALPKQEELEAFIERDRATWERKASRSKKRGKP